MRHIFAVIAVIVSILIASLVETPSEEVNSVWDWSATVYDNDPINPKILTIWWDTDQSYTPDTIWCVRHTLDEFVLERDFDLSKFEHLIPVVRKRLEENCGITGFRIIGAGIEDAI